MGHAPADSLLVHLPGRLHVLGVLLEQRPQEVGVRQAGVGLLARPVVDEQCVKPETDRSTSRHLSDDLNCNAAYVLGERYHDTYHAACYIAGA